MQWRSVTVAMLCLVSSRAVAQTDLYQYTYTVSKDATGKLSCKLDSQELAAEAQRIDIKVVAPAEAMLALHFDGAELPLTVSGTFRTAQAPLDDKPHELAASADASVNMQGCGK